MLRGNNRLTLNKATIIAALQYWCDATMTDFPMITEIEFNERADEATLWLQERKAEGPAEGK